MTLCFQDVSLVLNSIHQVRYKQVQGFSHVSHVRWQRSAATPAASCCRFSALFILLLFKLDLIYLSFMMQVCGPICIIYGCSTGEEPETNLPLWDNKVNLNLGTKNKNRTIKLQFNFQHILPVFQSFNEMWDLTSLTAELVNIKFDFTSLRQVFKRTISNFGH